MTGAALHHEIDIIYQDEHVVAINKPAGLLVHRSKVDPRAARFAMQMVRNQVGRHVFPVHRLDKPTSGVLLFGLSKDAARRLAPQFSNRSIKKSYLAIVRGYVEKSGTIDYPLREILDRKTDARARPDKAPQPAITVYEMLARVELPHPVGRYATARYSLVRLYPQSGRKHQLRRHMKHIFHPILGDRKFGDWRHNLFLEQQFDCRQLLLHASTLEFEHPFSNRRITIKAKTSDLFLRVAKEMKFDVEV